MILKKVLIGALAMIFATTVCQAQQITKQEKGYFNITELGYYTGNNSLKVGNSSGGYGTYTSSTYSFSLRNINGVFITSKISLGIGVGLENFSVNDRGINSNFFQVFGDARYYFKDDAATFFAYGQAGPSLEISSVFEKGAMYNVGVGYKFKIADRTAMNASLGVIDQYVSHDAYDLLQNRYYGLAFKVGLMF